MIGQIDRNLPVVSLYSSIGDLSAYFAFGERNSGPLGPERLYLATYRCW